MMSAMMNQSDVQSSLFCFQISIAHKSLLYAHCTLDTTRLRYGTARRGCGNANGRGAVRMALGKGRLWPLCWPWLRPDSVLCSSAYFDLKEDGAFPKPPSYNVATTLPSYDEAERTKAESVAIPLVTTYFSFSLFVCLFCSYGLCDQACIQCSFCPNASCAKTHTHP